MIRRETINQLFRVKTGKLQVGIMLALTAINHFRVKRQNKSYLGGCKERNSTVKQNEYHFANTCKTLTTFSHKNEALSLNIYRQAPFLYAGYLCLLT